MAQRRMFSKHITESDAFLELPATSQNLYFHLNMNADDDGFVNSPNRVMRNIGANKTDMEVLFAKKFLIAFETGIIVIKHWRIHNYIRGDRYKPTVYLEEKLMLELKENNSYKRIGIPNDIPVVSTGKVRLGKYSLDKDNIYSRVVNYLNDKAGTNYKANINKTRELIKARMNEGFTEDDFYQVIDIKVKEWINNKEMKQYLRPITLFGNKFESYLNKSTEVKSEIIDLPFIEEEE